MFCDQRLGIVGRLFQSGQHCFISHIAQSDANVPQQAATFGPEDLGKGLAISTKVAG
jgi:hypothetical protein